ncbi:MAG: hypothetical protein ABI190_10330 [Casimicrobiaceae bacterium]
MNNTVSNRALPLIRQSHTGKLACDNRLAMVRFGNVHPAVREPRADVSPLLALHPAGGRVCEETVLFRYTCLSGLPAASIIHHVTDRFMVNLGVVMEV